jgi:hypothetical protein
MAAAQSLDADSRADLPSDGPCGDPGVRDEACVMKLSGDGALRPREAEASHLSSAQRSVRSDDAAYEWADEDIDCEMLCESDED